MQGTIGKRIRKIRRLQDRTLQDIAGVCGFTKSLLCKIEADKTVPPVSTLTKIAGALDVQVSNLLDDSGNDGNVFTPAAKLSHKSMTVTDKGYSFFAFASERRGKNMQPYLFVAEKGKVKGKPLSHPGQEFVYVLEGSMKYRVGAVEYTLAPGDSLYFDSIEEHELKPVTAKVVYLGVFSEK
ncbi:MAG TPA: XRE family transcriptional regulator [Lentisphaeria bacterium]|nr:MAG: XRE family transcriptional regulator [Lentisphaerae bacterium GWF2_50_93]HCE42561.1 XRE family transcriptional regulator [Lentisphaeria bacterium]